MIAMVDMGISNLQSVRNALERINVQVKTVESPVDIQKAQLILLPGVGAFGDGIKALHDQQLVEPLRDAARQSKALVGICVGMQLLADSSEEYGSHKGLGVIPGKVVRLESHNPQDRIPNLNWCKIEPVSGKHVASVIDKEESLYFAHSYHMVTAQEHVAAHFNFSGQKITAAVEYGKIKGWQFHPEKSQDLGLDLLYQTLKPYTED